MWKQGLLLIMAVLLSGCQGLSWQQQRVLKNEGFIETNEGWVSDLSIKILFNHDRSELLPEGETRLVHLGQTLSQSGILHARLDGYADASGEEAYNKQLSLKRAERVADALAKGGIPRGYLQTRGLGFQNPVKSNRTSAGRAQNRRVAIVIVSG